MKEQNLMKQGNSLHATVRPKARRFKLIGKFLNNGKEETAPEVYYVENITRRYDSINGGRKIL